MADSVSLKWEALSKLSFAPELCLCFNLDPAFVVEKLPFPKISNQVTISRLGYLMCCLIFLKLYTFLKLE